MPTLHEQLGKRTANSSVDNDGRVVDEYVREFQLRSETQISAYQARIYLGVFVYTSHAMDPPLLVTGSNGFGDPYAFAKSVSVKDEENRNPWTFACTVNYSSALPEQKDENPFMEPIQIRVTGETANQSIIQDINGDAIINAAGDLYDPGVEVPYGMARYSFTRNEFTMPTGIGLYMGKLNQSTFLGAPRGQVRCENVGTERRVRGQYVYWPTSYEFLVNPLQTFQPRLLNAGAREKKEIDGQTRLVAILDGNRNQVSSPWPLDSSGRALAGDSVDPSNWIVTTYDALQYANFNAIGLPV